MTLLKKTNLGEKTMSLWSLPIFNRARSKDPITSFQAADSIKEAAPQHFRIILEALVTHGPMGKDGIALKTGLNPNAVSRRLPELQKLNLVTTTGKTVKSLSGREEREWKSL
jgi:predicted transcriptional regulator